MKTLFLSLIACTAILLSVKSYAEDDNPCGYKVRLVQPVNSGQSQQALAIETLIAENGIAHYADASYQAGRSVTLLPGFVAEKGAVFTARINNCFCGQAGTEASLMTITAYPNPFVESATIQYKLISSSPVSLQVLDEQGKLIDTLVDNKFQEAGAHTYTYRSSSSATMLYFFSLRTEQGVFTKRVIKRSN